MKEKHDISEKDTQDISAKRQKMIDGWIARNEDGFTKTVEFCITWASCGLSYSLVAFAKTFSLSYPASMNRTSISESMNKLAEKFDRAVQDKIRGCACTLCFDGWTNHGQRIVNLVSTCEGCAYYLDSILVEHNDEVTLKTILDKGKRIVNEMGAILVAVSGDNFSGVVAAISNFCLENPQIIEFLCLAHSVQLTIKDLLRLSPLKYIN